MEDLDICISITDTLSLTIAECITVVTMVYMDKGIKRPATIPLEILEFIILVMMYRRIQVSRYKPLFL